MAVPPSPHPLEAYTLLSGSDNVGSNKIDSYCEFYLFLIFTFPRISLKILVLIYNMKKLNFLPKLWPWLCPCKVLQLKFWPFSASIFLQGKRVYLVVYTYLSCVPLFVVNEVNSVKRISQIVLCDPLPIVLSSLCRNSYDNSRLRKVNLLRNSSQQSAL